MPINPTYVFKKNLKKITKSSLYHLQRNQPNPIDNLWAFFGSLLALSVIGLLQILLKNGDSQDLLFLIGAFGATSVLLFGATNSPLAQPRNMIFGSLISAIIGVTIYRLFNSSDFLWLSPALAVSLSILAMQYTKTLHPPGGAIALIANIGSSEIKEMSFFYVIYPVLSGVVILFIVALIFNSISRNRIYPYRNVNIRKLGYFQKILFWRAERSESLPLKKVK